MSDAGRPSLYQEKYCKEIIKYFSVKPYVKKNGRNVASDMPTFAGFASSIGVHRDTLHEWVKQHDSFSNAYKMAKDLQENFLVVNGCRGLINPIFAIFTAKNVLRWSDKPEEEKKDQSSDTITLAYAAPEKKRPA